MAGCKVQGLAASLGPGPGPPTFPPLRAPEVIAPRRLGNVAANRRGEGRARLADPWGAVGSGGLRDSSKTRMLKAKILFVGPCEVRPGAAGRP